MNFTISEKFNKMRHQQVDDVIKVQLVLERYAVENKTFETLPEVSRGNGGPSCFKRPGFHQLGPVDVVNVVDRFSG